MQGLASASSYVQLELDPDLGDSKATNSLHTPEQLLTSRQILQTLSNQLQMASTVKLKVKTMAPATYDLEAPSNVRHVPRHRLDHGLAAWPQRQLLRHNAAHWPQQQAMLAPPFQVHVQGMW